MDEKLLKLSIASDTTEEYLKPKEISALSETEISIRIPRELKVSGVCLIYNEDRIEAKRRHKGVFDIYTAKFSMPEVECFEYYFEINRAEESFYYDAGGVNYDLDNLHKFWILPGQHTPDWAKGAIYYQIFVDRFYNGDKSNDVLDGEYRYIDRLVSSSAWGDKVAADGIGQFYGGDIEGVRQKLGYLKHLGVEVIYLNPIFVSPSNHKYDTSDYDYIDPHFGVIPYDKGEVLTNKREKNSDATRLRERITNDANLDASNALFAKFVQEAHGHGIKVILDGVFNHAGAQGKWMDRDKIYEKAVGYKKGAYADKKSPYKDYFIFKNNNWPDNADYEAWWGYDTLPKLNYKNRELYDKILEIGAKWVSEPYNCDGWRLDVASDLGPDRESNHRFWRDFSARVKEANPEAIIIAEHYEDARDWFKGREWDSVMNYNAFMEPFTYFLTGMEKHSDEYKEELLASTEAFWETMAKNRAGFMAHSDLTAMNELSNHDHSRFLTRTNHKVGRVDKLGAEAATEDVSKSVFKMGVVAQMTWPGCPAIYYGDEAGLGGFTDPDNRRCYPWGEEDRELISFHKEIIAIHKSQEALRKGTLIRLPSVKGTLAYARKYDKNVIIVLMNMYDINMEMNIEGWMLGLSKKLKLDVLLRTGDEPRMRLGKHYQGDKERITVQVAPKGTAILKLR